MHLQANIVCVPFVAIFQLPLLSLPRNEMFSDAVIDRVGKTYSKYDLEEVIHIFALHD